MYRTFLHLKNVNTASQNNCAFYMILITKRKYFPLLQKQVLFFTELERVYCAVRTDSIEVCVMSPLKWLFHDSVGQSPSSESRSLVSVRRHSIQDMLSTKCGFVMDSFLSIYFIPCQYHSAHALYSSSSNVARTRKTVSHGLEAFRKE